MPTAGGASGATQLRKRRKVLDARLQQLDADHDGVISKDELLDFVEHCIDTETRLRHLKWIAIITVIFCIVLLGAIAGLTAGIVKANQQTKTASGALADKSNSQTLRTAAASFSKPQVSLLTVAARRRLHAAGGSLIPLGSIPSGTVAQYCRYLNEGHNGIPTAAMINNGGTIVNRDAIYPLTITAEDQCTDWAASLGTISSDPPVPQPGATGNFSYESLNYFVACAGGAISCQLAIVNDTALAALTNGNSTGSNNATTASSATGASSMFLTGLAGCTSNCGCFPGSALVTARRDGSAHPEVLRMEQLHIGDKVLTRGPGGSLVYDDVYVFGHEDPAALSTFVQIHIQGAEQPLELTSGHFVPVASATSTRRMKRAQDVRVGDTMYQAVGGRLQPEAVTRVAFVERRGLYNPFTLGGDIVVNGVLTSVHSEWFLDATVPDAWAHHLPAVYQALMTPARLLYRTFGAQAVRCMDAAVGGFATVAGGNRGSLAGFVKAHALMLRGQVGIHKGAL